MAGAFLVLVTAIVVLSVREWILLLRAAQAGGAARDRAGLAAGLRRRRVQTGAPRGPCCACRCLGEELSGEAQWTRAQESQEQHLCDCEHGAGQPIRQPQKR